MAFASARLRRALGQLLIISATTLVLAELLVRIVQPRTRVNVVRASTSNHFRVTPAGTPIWDAKLKRAPCSERAPGALRIAFLGTSITNGYPVTPEQAFPALLERALTVRYPGGVCVDNYAVPSFGIEQELVSAQEHLAKDRVALVMVEVWDTAKRYGVLGHAAYDLRGYAADREGYPVVPGVPSGLNHLLFGWSSLYEYAALALVPELPRGAELGASEPARPTAEAYFCDVAVPRLGELSRAAGAALLLYFPSTLDQPFAASVPLREGHETLEIDCVRRLAVPFLRFAEQLQGQDEKLLRADSCHFNAVGHAAVAHMLEQHVPALLAPPAAPRQGAAP